MGVTSSKCHCHQCHYSSAQPCQASSASSARRTVRHQRECHQVHSLLCVTTETRPLDRLCQFSEFGQESNTNSQQDSNTDSHSTRNKAQVAQQSTAKPGGKAPQRQEQSSQQANRVHMCYVYHRDTASRRHKQGSHPAAKHLSRPVSARRGSCSCELLIKSLRCNTDRAAPARAAGRRDQQLAGPTAGWQDQQLAGVINSWLAGPTAGWQG